MPAPKLAIPNEYGHPDLIAMMQRIIDIANRSHVAAGSWFGKREQMERTINQGSRLLRLPMLISLEFIPPIQLP